MPPHPLELAQGMGGILVDSTHTFAIMTMLIAVKHLKQRHEPETPPPEFEFRNKICIEANNCVRFQTKHRVEFPAIVPLYHRNMT